MPKAFASTTGYIRLPQRGSHKEANNAAEFDVSDTAGASAMEMLIEADYGAEVKVGTFDCVSWGPDWCAGGGVIKDAPLRPDCRGHQR